MFSWGVGGGECRFALDALYTDIKAVSFPGRLFYLEQHRTAPHQTDLCATCLSGLTQKEVSCGSEHLGGIGR